MPSSEETAPISWPCPNLAPHVLPSAANADVLPWQSTSPGDVRRVINYTCACRATVFELCTLGGHLLVRRTHRYRNTVLIHYAGPWPRDIGDRWWIRLISGRAM